MQLGREIRVIQIEPEAMDTPAEQPIRSHYSPGSITRNAQTLMSLKAIRDHTSDNNR